MINDKGEEKPGAYLLRLPSGDLEKVQSEAKALGISTGDFFRMLVAQYFNGIIFQRKAKE
jgi:hypothetical protein